jgi:hypothetical protein
MSRIPPKKEIQMRCYPQPYKDGLLSETLSTFDPPFLFFFQSFLSMIGSVIRIDRGHMNEASELD